MATATITLGEQITSEPSGRTYTAVTAQCSDCNYAGYTGGDPDRDWSHMIDYHLVQHNPDRALDIEVDYIIHADCSVCEGGGDVYQEDDGLRCADCGTTWDMTGRSGYRGES